MKIALIALALISLSAPTFAKAPYKKALGVADCAVCHVKGDFKKANDASPLYKKAKLHSDNIANGVEGFKGKTCNDCHNGSQKPAAK